MASLVDFQSDGSKEVPWHGEVSHQLTATKGTRDQLWLLSRLINKPPPST
jgi:hypothetical protein